jgi:DNA replication protein DnaC
MRQTAEGIDTAVVRQQCKALKLPTIGSQFEALAGEAARRNQSHTSYLQALFAAELDDRERRLIERRVREARIPRMKTLEEFDFTKSPNISASLVRELSEGGYVTRGEPVVLIGECGTGKTHLATGLCVAAAKQKRKVRFTTATGLINELVEAQHRQTLGRALQRWATYDLIAVDEIGYVPFAEVGAELLYQVISDRAERSALIVTTNLPFSEWTQVFPNTRLCKAVLDRVTDRAHIIETGTESFRFRRTLERQQKGKRKS